MITEAVRNRRVFVNVSGWIWMGQAADVEFVLDSGFTGVTTFAPRLAPR